MCEARFHFMARGTANGSTAETRLAAAILANCLSRQGFRARAEENTVYAALPANQGDRPGDTFLILDESALRRPELLEQVDSRSAIVVCSARPARVLQRELGRLGAGIATVDAEGIAGEEGSEPVVAMLGGAARLVPLIDPDALCAAVWSTFDHGYPYAARAAMRTFDLGYMQAQQAPAIYAQ